jgi:hypothetical protein
LATLRLYSNKLEGHSFIIFGGGHTRLTTWFFVQFYAGNIPESFGNQASLESLELQRNQLSGQFPHFFGWSVPTDHLIFTDFPRRNHPRVPSKTWEVGILEPARQPTIRSFLMLFCWSVPTDHLIFRSILRRECPWIFGEPWELAAVVPFQQPALRSIFLVFRGGRTPLTIWISLIFLRFFASLFIKDTCKC